jgi:HK97 family phage portal protein
LAPVEYLTEGGLVVTDRRHDRAVPNGNPPSTVGPDSLNPGRNVMWDANRTPPVESVAWDGWPVDWNPPPYGPDWSGYGAGRFNSSWAKVATAFTCVDLNSRQLGSFPVYGMKGDTPVALPEWSSSPEPALYESWPQFLQGAVNSLLLRGEVITLVTGRYTSGQIARFITLNPDLVDVEFIDGRQRFTLAGEELPEGDVLLTRYQSIPGRLRGIGPLEWAAQSLVTASALETQAAAMASKGGVPWAVLKGQANINAQQAAEAQARWVASSRRDGAPAVLGNGWDLETLTFSPKDMALLELKEVSSREICAAFGVPAFLVNVAMASGLTYSNATSLFFQHWTATLRPMANLIAAAWSRWLLPRGTRIEFNADRYTQPELGPRMATWQTAFNIQDPATGERVMSVAEIRAAERLAPLPAGQDAPNLDAQTLTGASQ